MKLKNLYKILLTAFFLSWLASPAFPVTKAEMDKARAIAAKAYIRYANDASGYLDEIDVNTIEELENVVKPKEKENLQTFKAIPVPSDYQGWNKEQLVEYWAVKAFQTKGLLEKGLGGRIRARSQINKMSVSAPAPAPQEASAQSEIPAENENNGELNSELEELNAGNLEDTEDLDQNLNVDKAPNYTWVYIMVLGILLFIVLLLVIYAVKVMKKNDNTRDHDRRYHDRDEDNEVEQYEAAISDKNVEIAMLNKKIETLTRQNSELRNKIEALEKERENSTVKPIQAAPQPVTRPAGETPQKKPHVRTIFLGRANARGIFVRADRSLNVGNSVFVLETTDGYSGYFKVADSQAAWSLALSNPAEYLETACTGPDLENTSTASRIVTETPGSAVFEGGCWKVIRKAKIRYE